MPPSGNTSAATQAYYTWLYSQYYAQATPDRTQILWSGPFFIALWAVVLIGFFWLYSRYLQRVHREQGELYGVASFGGSILERIGRIAVFSYVVWALITAWGFFYAIRHAVAGQVY